MNLWCILVDEDVRHLDIVLVEDVLHHLQWQGYCRVEGAFLRAWCTNCGGQGPRVVEAAAASRSRLWLLAAVEKRGRAWVPAVSAVRVIECMCVRRHSEDG